MGRLRNYFLTGFIVCAPMAITAWITWTFMQWTDSWVKPYIPTRFLPDSYLPFAIPGVGLLFALIVITMIGFLTANFIGRTVFGWGERALGRMPLVRTVYTALKQIFETVLADRSSSFKTAGLIEYPRKGVWAVVLIASTAKGEVAKVLSDQGEEMLAVLMPPTPSPAAGFLMFLPKSEVRILDMSIEDALKLIVSAGIVSSEGNGGPLSRTEATRIVEERVQRQAAE